MELDAARLTHDAAREVDVCVVGAGPAGLVVARTLAERGRRVLLLESGAAGPDAAADALNDGDVVGDPYVGLRATRDRRVGGTMGLWNTDVGGAAGAKWVPLDPVDVDGRWPLDHAALVPYYARAQRLCGLGPFAYDAAAWVQPDRPAFQHDGSGLLSRVYQLGTRDALLGPTVASVRETGNAILCTRATVVRLEPSPDGRRVARAIVATPDGERRLVGARRWVLAAGAVENARLLLHSGIASGPVGQCFMEHPRDRAIVLRPRTERAYRGAAFYDVHRAADGTAIVGRLALDGRVVRESGLPNASGTLLPNVRPWVRRARAALGPAGRAPAVRAWLPVGGHGWSRHHAPTRAFAGLTVLLNVEQAPHPENRVTLGARRDAHGVPLPVLHWRWRTEDHVRLVRLRAAVARGLAALGIGDVTVATDAPPDPNAHHHAGTTRMHADPRAGVVDAHGRVHALDDLYVAGASVFPTAGYANPTLTIVALALRLAEHLDATL